MKLFKQTAMYQKTHATTATTRAIASLPVVMLLGVIMVEIGIAGTLLLSYLNNSVYGVRLANDAFAAAHSGIQDAILRVILNKNCGSDATCPGTPYTIDVGTASAEVTICKDSCTGTPTVGAGQTRIIARGTSLTKERRLIALLTVDAGSGEVRLVSLTETAE